MSEKNVFEELRQILNRAKCDIAEKRIDKDQFTGGQIDGLSMACYAADNLEMKWLDEKLSHAKWIQTSKRLPNATRDRSAINFCDEERGHAFIVMINGAEHPTQLYLTKKNEWVDDELHVYDVDAWCKIPSSLDDVWIKVSDRLPDDIERIRDDNHFLVLIEGAFVPTALNITQGNCWVDSKLKKYKVHAWTHFPNAYFSDEVNANG